MWIYFLHQFCKFVTFGEFIHFLVYLLNLLIVSIEDWIGLLFEHIGIYKLSLKGLYFPCCIADKDVQVLKLLSYVDSLICVGL